MSKDIIDVEDALERVQDDKELFLELLDIFEEDYLEKRKQIAEMLDKEDHEQVANLAHSMKGAAGNISAKAIQGTCSQIEQLAESKKLDSVQGLIDTLDEQFKSLKSCMVTVKEQLTSG